MKTNLFAVQTAAGDYSLDNLHVARPFIGGSYIHRPDDATPFLMVCSPSDVVAAGTWLAANGWTVLPHILNFGTSVGAASQALLLGHSPDVLATDTTVTAMTKVVATTQMQCFHPFS
jgi:hypothetical protein